MLNLMKLQLNWKAENFKFVCLIAIGAAICRPLCFFFKNKFVELKSFRIFVLNKNKMEKQAMNLINLYNDKGEKHGYWEIYFYNGQLSLKGSYLNDKKHGDWESYWSNGKLSYKGSFLNGEKHGDWESYWGNGKLDYKKTYDNGKEVKEITELTLEDIANKFGISVNNLKIKK